MEMHPPVWISAASHHTRTQIIDSSISIFPFSSSSRRELLIRARLLQVVAEEGERGGAENRAEGRDGGGGGGGGAGGGGRGRALGGEGHGGGGGDKDGAGDLLHLHPFFVEAGGLGRTDERTYESTGEERKARKKKGALFGWLCVPAALPEEWGGRGRRHL